MRYAVPIYLLARLAVDKAYQGQGISGPLLVKGLSRCKRVTEEVGGIGLLIDAKNEAVADWYQLFGAIPLPDHPLTLDYSVFSIELSGQFSIRIEKSGRITALFYFAFNISFISVSN